MRNILIICVAIAVMVTLGGVMAGAVFNAARRVSETIGNDALWIGSCIITGATEVCVFLAAWAGNS